MRIGINTLFLFPSKRAGTLTYVSNLVRALSQVDTENEYILFTNSQNHDVFKTDAKNFRRHLCPYVPENSMLRVLYEQMILPYYAKQFGLNVLHAPGDVPPIMAKCAKVVTLHDMQYIAWYAHYPQYASKAKLLYVKYLYPLGARKSEVIVTISENSKKDIVKYLGIPENKILVIYEASRFSLGTNQIEPDLNIFNKHRIKKDYILSVASFLPHKNLNRLIESYALLMNNIEHQVVLTGMNLHGMNLVKEMVRKKNVAADRVIFTGYVSEAELIALYQNASLFVLPSLFEGFGLPLLEAMSLGCPVAASSRTSIPEVVGDAGVLFEPEDPKAMADAIYSILSDANLRDRLIDKGYKREKAFTWEKTARETLEAYSLAYERWKQNMS
jgi:glycosyltransferase involved in cell wall biosynthesis